MSIYLAIPLFILLSVLQVSVVPGFAVFHVKPDLLLVVIACWGVICGPRQALLWAVIGGFFADLLGNTPFGTTSIALSVVAALTSLSESAWFDRNLLLALFITFLGSLSYSIAFLAVLELAGRHAQWTAIFQNIILPGAVFNTILVPLAYWSLSRVYRRTRKFQEFEW